MAGFFGLFGGKSKYVDEPEQENNSNNEQSGAYFLSSDESKTYGNIEFMRTPQKIRRSFPKRANSQGSEIVREISSMEEIKGNKIGSANSMSESQQGSNFSPAANSNNELERRRADNSMDMFRKMAKDMKK